MFLRLFKVDFQGQLSEFENFGKLTPFKPWTKLSLAVVGTYKAEQNLNGTLEPEVPKIPDAQSSDDSEDSEKSRSDAETPTVVEIPRKG